MSAPVKLAVFVAVLAVLFAGGALAGGAVGPDRSDSSPARADAAPEKANAHGSDAPSRKAGSSAAHGSTGVKSAHGAGADKGKASHPVRGLAVAENGLRLVVADAELRRGRTENVRFRVVDDGGRTVRDFDVGHTKRMHVIVARRDLTNFQHVHPRQSADGSWSVPVKLGEAGSYRLFADFSFAKEPYTLATDLRVDGAAELAPLPAVSPAAVSDGGYDVRLNAGSARPGAEADLRFTITKNGRTVHTEPYLGAGGHLVALREGDLAFLHVHPTDGAHGDDAKTDAHDDAVAFAATFPTSGRYRLFLQFQHERRVQTVAFTQEVK